MLDQSRDREGGRKDAGLLLSGYCSSLFRPVDSTRGGLHVATVVFTIHSHSPRRAAWLIRAGVACVACAFALPAAAQSADGRNQGAPAPQAPSTITRDAQGKATVRAVRLAAPLRLDGRLDEAIYNEVAPFSGFIQNDPRSGAPATEKTDVWVLFDEDNVYVSARCWDEHPERIAGNEMRRDNNNIPQDDTFAWSFDTFYDRRNFLSFVVSASGGRNDTQVTNERQLAVEWNPVWRVRTSRFEQGYLVEAAIPFKSIRYQQGAAQVWGFQARRRIAAKNEISYLTPVPAAIGSTGIFRSSLAGTLVGLEAPERGRNVDIKPYAVGNVTTDRLAVPPVSNDPGATAGVDVKYSVTQNLAADLTVNTDFAQAEADEQQVNLTRFSLFFPERRDFFLENAGLFAFGGTTAGGDVPMLFYSRNIGLSRGRAVPIRAGGRLSGRVGRFTLGALQVRSGGDEAAAAQPTDFSVVRVTRDVLKNSSIGAIVTNRSVSAQGGGANRAAGLDGNFALGPYLLVGGNWARTATTDTTASSDNTYRGFLTYDSDRYGLQADHVRVGARFDPQIGFVQRRNMRKNFVLARFSPRPRQNRRVRKYSYQTSFTHITNTAGRLETRRLEGRFGIDLQSSDTFVATVSDQYEFLPAPFALATNVRMPVGGYNFNNATATYTFGRQRKLAGGLGIDAGTFYDGRKTTWTISAARYSPTSRFALEPALSINQVDVSAGSFTTRLLTTRFTVMMTPLMFATGLVQYNSGSNTIGTNIRFRWEYTPGSEFFLVYNDQRDTGPVGLQNRAVVVKVTRLLRF